MARPTRKDPLFISTPPPSNWLPDEPRTPRSVDPQKKPNNQIIVATVAIVVVILGLSIVTLNYEPEEQSMTDIMATATSPAPREEETTSNDSEDILGWSRAEARSACHDKIEDQLDTPSTAEFEGLFDAEFSKTDGGSTWRIDGYVDAQNLFGAELRSNYSCTVTPSSEDRATVNAYLEE